MRVRRPRYLAYPYYGCSLLTSGCSPNHHLRSQPEPPTVAASGPYGCSLGYVRLQPRATYGCRYAGYSPDEWLAEVSGVPFGLPGQILGTNTDQAQVCRMWMQM